MPDYESKSSRIAIQLGQASTSSSHGIKKRTRPTHAKRHRAHALDASSESGDDSDRDQQAYGHQETITSYDILGPGLDDGKTQRQNHLGRENTEAMKNRKEGNEANQEKEKDSITGRDGIEAEKSEPQDKPVKWGLTINMKGAGRSKTSGTGELRAPTERPSKEEVLGPKDNSVKSIEDEALDALMGSRAPKRKHVNSDAADREPQAEDYRSVPIDDFGAQLLRNFGWDGKMRGKVKEVTRHANLTGLGAKDVKGAEDLGAWNQKTVKDSRPVRLDDYRREENKKRQRFEDRYADSYKRERERERERERGRDR